MKYNWQNMEYDEINDKFTCPEGKKIEYINTKEEKTETGFIQEIRVYECSECRNCLHKSECTKAKGNRKIRFNKKLWQLKQVVKRNLMSEKGIEMRRKRAEYSEGIFGQIKWNMGFKRFLLRGLEKVDLEWGLLCFALNIKRMNKKDKEKLREIAMAKAISISKKYNKLLEQKIQLLSSWIFCLSGSYFRTPSCFIIHMESYSVNAKVEKENILLPYTTRWVVLICESNMQMCRSNFYYKSTC